MTGTILAALLATAPAPVIAQDAAAVEEDEQICLAIGRRWVGTPAERRAIESRPVPDSFRDAYFGTGCGRFSLIVDSFVDWHLKYGTAQSTLAAIDFFEADAKKNAPSKDWIATLPKTWDAAEAATTDFLDERQVTVKNLHDNQTWRAWHKLPEIRALNAMSAYQEQLNFIANEYARAAEFFVDAALYEKAAYYHQQVVAAQAHVTERKAAAQGEVADFVLNPFEIRFYSPRKSVRSRGLSLAVTNAFVHRDAESILAAHDALNRTYDENYWQFRNAVTHIGWDEAWEVREDGWQNDAYRARKHDNFFVPDAVQFFIQRSRLLLLAEAEGVALPPSGRHTLDMALKRGAIFEVGLTLQMLMLRDRRENYGLQANDYSDEFIGLALLLAETDLAKGVAQCAKPESDSERTNRLPYALNQLIILAELTDRVEQARYYRRIATSYRAGYRAYVQCDPDAVHNDDLTAHDRLFAADLSALDGNDKAP